MIEVDFASFCPPETWWLNGLNARPTLTAEGLLKETKGTSRKVGRYAHSDHPGRPHRGRSGAGASCRICASGKKGENKARVRRCGRGPDTKRGPDKRKGAPPRSKGGGAPRLERSRGGSQGTPRGSASSRTAHTPERRKPRAQDGKRRPTRPRLGRTRAEPG